MICIQMLYTKGWEEMANVIMPTMIEYSNRHGYKYAPRIIDEPYDGFDKIKMCYNLFELHNVDIILNMDADAVVTNRQKRVEDFLEDGKDFYIAQDCNTINAGIFIIKKSAWSKGFLTYLMSCKGKEGMECEQNAIQSYMNEFPNDNKINILPPHSINDYPLDEYKPSYGKWGYRDGDIVEKPKNDWDEKSFILHCPGLPLEKRLSILKNTTILK